METYSVKDLAGYAKSVRDAAASALKEDYTENLEEFITLKQVISLVKDYSIGFDENDNFLINEEIHGLIYDDIQKWIFNAGLAKLAANGLIECAWDDEINEMVFWASDGDKNDGSTKQKRKNRENKR